VFAQTVRDRAARDITGAYVPARRARGRFTPVATGQGLFFLLIALSMGSYASAVGGIGTLNFTSSSGLFRPDLQNGFFGALFRNGPRPWPCRGPGRPR